MNNTVYSGNMKARVNLQDFSLNGDTIKVDLNEIRYMFGLESDDTG
jgi:hypothetical protein